jgi:tetratricopeptide (TPR) repeat protein
MKTIENYKFRMNTKRWLTLSFSSLMLIVTAISSFGQTNPNVEKAFYLIDVEQSKKGMALLEETVKANPLDAAVLYNLGIAQLRAGMKDKALATFEKGISLNEKEALNVAGKAHVLLLDKKPADAKLLFDKALSMTKSKNVDVLNAVAEGYLADSKYVPNAIEMLTKAKNVGPNVNTYILLGDAHLKAHNGGLAVTSYEDAASVKKTDAKPHYKIGGVYQSNRNYTAVEEAFNKAIALDPNYAPVYRELAEMYYRKKEGAKAAQNQEKYLSLIEDPSEKEKVKLPYMYFMAKDYAKANKMFEPFLAKPDVDATTLKFAAFSYSEAGDLEKSRLLVEQFMAKGKKEDLEASDYASYAKLLSKLKPDASLPKAAQDTKKRELDSLSLNAYVTSLELDPTQGEVLQTAADLQFKLNHFPEAISSYRKLLTMKRQPSTNLFALGRSYFYSLQFQKADSTFIKFQELQPTLSIGYLWEAKSKVQLDPESKTNQAKIAYEKVVEKASVDPVKNKADLIQAYNYLAPYYYYNGKQDWPLAKAAYQKLIDLNPENTEAYKAALSDIKKVESAPPPKP